ncbi:MAG: DUF3782 domain-containing protein [Magnetococcales bacterium]|nr:DUF3782 domain-containing protein [Magnetococcales bacterium]
MQESDRRMREASAEADRKMREMSESADRKAREMSESADRKAREMSESADRKAREMSAEADRKAREMSAEAERKAREMSAEIERKIWASFAEEDRRRQESDDRFNRRLEALDAMLAEVTIKIDKAAILVGNLGSRWGDFVEGIVAAASVNLFARWGIPVHRMTRNVKAFLPGNRRMEIDVLISNTTIIIAVEAKSRLTLEHVQKYEKKLKEFKTFFPDYADKQLIGAVAGIVIDDQVDQYAMEQGLFVILQSGETVTLANDAEFVPKIW